MRKCETCGYTRQGDEQCAFMVDGGKVSCDQCFRLGLSRMPIAELANLVGAQMLENYMVDN